MQTKIARWGDGLAVRLPADFVRELGLSEGQVVDLTSNATHIELTPSLKERRVVNGLPVYTMEELLADMDRLGPEAVPRLLDWGPDRGSEIIGDDCPPDLVSSRNAS